MFQEASKGEPLLHFLTNPCLLKSLAHRARNQTPGRKYSKAKALPWGNSGLYTLPQLVTEPKNPKSHPFYRYLSLVYPENKQGRVSSHQAEKGSLHLRWFSKLSEMQGLQFWRFQQAPIASQHRPAQMVHFSWPRVESKRFDRPVLVKTEPKCNKLVGLIGSVSC